MQPFNLVLDNNNGENIYVSSYRGFQDKLSIILKRLDSPDYPQGYGGNWEYAFSALDGSDYEGLNDFFIDILDVSDREVVILEVYESPGSGLTLCRSESTVTLRTNEEIDYNMCLDGFQKTAGFHPDFDEVDVYFRVIKRMML